MKSSGDILLVVLGSQGHLRSATLENLSGNITKCIFVDPVRIDKKNRTGELVDERLSEILLGKRLSDPELGCAITHKNGCIAALAALENQDKIKWALFVEDDADLGGSTFEDIRAELVTFDSELPSLVTYYSASNCGSNSKIFNERIKQQPVISQHWASGAVCYAVNLSGLIDLRPFSILPVNYVADWPVYYSRLKRFVSKEIQVCEVKGPSSIGERHNQKFAERLFMHIYQLVYLRKLANLYNLPVGLVMRHLIVAPLTRDASVRLSTIKFRPHNLKKLRFLARK